MSLEHGANNNKTPAFINHELLCRQSELNGLKRGTPRAISIYTLWEGFSQMYIWRLPPGLRACAGGGLVQEIPAVWLQSAYGSVSAPYGALFWKSLR